jgi:hypothetical protein
VLRSTAPGLRPRYGRDAESVGSGQRGRDQTIKT